MFKPTRSILSLVPVMMLALVATISPGCESVSDVPMVGTLIDPPPTPGEAARDAFDVYDPDKRRRSVALIAASPFGHEEPYMKMYRMLIDDPDPTVRAACANALGLHGSVVDAPKLTILLEDDNSFVRWEAARSLQRIHSDVAITALSKRLNEDEDPDVRQAAATALGQYPRSDVFDNLVAALSDADHSVVSAAADSLATLTGRNLGNDARDWLKWAESNRGSLFTNQQTYTYLPYQRPKGWFGTLQFWSEDQQVEPRTPAGMTTNDEPAPSDS